MEQTVNQQKPDLGAYLTYFNPIIQELLQLRDKNDYRNNVVIAGTHALQLHGLEIPREPGDLDIAIYKINEQQYEYLQKLKVFAIGKYNADWDVKNCKAIMFKKFGMLLNIILEHKENCPYDLLKYNFGGTHILVQTIKGVVEAKTSYRLNPHTTTQSGERYSRVKDYYDLLELKNRNFNMPYDAPKVNIEEPNY